MKIAIIGAGNMGGSIARGLAKGSLIDDSDIIVSNPSAGKLEKLKKEFPGISTTNNNLEAATGADIVILAVKPWFMESVMRELKLKSKQILISVAAGISFEELAHYVVAQEMAMFSLYPMIGQYISGTTASGLYEARLGYEEMGKENHVFAPAYKEKDKEELVQICDHVIFNSFAQYEKYQHYFLQQECTASAGIRVNPECSTQEGHENYDPCGSGSRLGVVKSEFPDQLPEGIEGLHFHTLCEQNADDLITTWHAFEEKFGSYLKQVKWLNLGGGHHITRADYQLDELKKLICEIRRKYNVRVYLEPGEAIALNAGYLVTEVMDSVHNGLDILILDASAACHMPDVLEMPYRPPLKDGYLPGEKPHTCRLSSMTCLAGDVIGDYSFAQKKQVGDRLGFEYMAIYSMVKNNTFNGMPLPDIAVMGAEKECRVIRRVGYEDFKGRLS